VTPRLTRDAARRELELRLTSGQCAYCGTHASPDRPLTREHLIPRSKGGGRHDHRIIVPACVPCNQRRGCQELILFLLSRPRRIAALLDHFVSLSPETLRIIDPLVLAEVYAALWVLDECARAGDCWQTRLKRVCGGRTVHRRRYAARRIMQAVAARLARSQERSSSPTGPTCLLPAAEANEATPGQDLGVPVEVSRARLMSLLSLVWWSPAEEVEVAIRAATASAASLGAAPADLPGEETPARRGRKRRARVDPRHGGRRRVRRGGYSRAA
jgi:hypothetical protein